MKRRSAYAICLGALACSLLSALPPALCLAQDLIPKRIVSLAPNITREISDLGAQQTLVGVASHSPSNAGSSAAIVGSPGRVNIEKAFALRPDLVIASTDCNARSDVKALKNLGCRVYVFKGCESFNCMCSDFLQLGSMLGKRGRAEEIVAQVKARLETVQGKIKGVKPLKVFWQLGDNPLVTVSDKTFSGEFLLRAGCINIFGDAVVGYPRVNSEEVIRRNPDVIVVVSKMGPNANTTPWLRFKTVGALRNNRIYEIPADLVCQPTPIMFLKGFEAVAAMLYPGLL